MAAAKGNKNAVGNSGGKSFNDRKLAAAVRTLALTEIQKYLEGKEDGYKDKDMKNAIILKLAPSLLPRLNEHTGDDGKELFPVPIYGGQSQNPGHDSDQEGIQSQEEN
jgi:hypothetical protein